MKKFICLCLLALIFISCSNSTNNPANNETTSADPDNIETTADPELPNIADADYGYRDFVLYYCDWSLYADYYFADSQNGEIVNDACYDRTVLIEEKLKINIKPLPTTELDCGTEQIVKLRASVFANDPTYDLLLLHCCTSMITFTSDKLVMNWNDIPIIDMNKSYWNQSVSKNMNIYGMLPFAANDFVLPDVNSIFFHTQLLNDLKLDNPYDVVTSGKWTWDKLNQMASVASADINGDGVFNAEDQYGFVGEMGWQFMSIPTSCDLFPFITDSDGVLQLNINTPTMISLVEKLQYLLHNNKTSFTWPYSAATDPNIGNPPPVRFDSGRALFYLVPLSLAKTFRETDLDFGILPLPKYDDKQDDYITLNWAGFLTIPLTVRDVELTAKVVELLAYYNKQYVVPVFRDVLLGQKISRNDRSNEMLNIIFDNTVYDIAIPIDSPSYNIMVDIVAKNSDFVSYYAKNENTWQKRIDNYYNAHVEYMETK
ncbi:MAG: hypothetical protein FWF15_04245 [Oscillospiraceae bacterium]|nr:hypothetical protein [Oscillospiraceae bacterium]